ncbi:hypothetical protein ScPMuIL_018914 [Solemya velum]
MGFFSSVKKYKNQDYSKLKKESQSRGHLFIDPEFPPDDKSLFYTPGKVGQVVWKRPKDICTDPKLFVGGASSGDVTQGRLGNCWFVAASSCLAQYKEIWHQVIPDSESQEWDEKKPENYQGIFYFQFWRYGEWLEVVIDDLLPTSNNELIFIHSQSKNEFWSALLEKAYAKLFGCYEALDGGDLGEALEDFTGGVSNFMSLKEARKETNAEEHTALFVKMQKEMERKSLMAASIPAESSEEMEATTDCGLVKGHAYGITQVKNISLEGTGGFFGFGGEKLAMIRIRNPWGQGEWKGAFSDGSEEWNKISKSDREKVGLTFEEDGEFWMSFEDFCKYYDNVSICRVVNTSFFSLAKTWHEGVGHGSWKKPDRVGGCLNNKETFLHNPQFRFDITSDEDEPIMQLMQKSTRGEGGSQNITIGFTIVKVEENRRCRIHDLAYQEIVKSTVFRDSRSIFLRHTLKKGRYVIIACTFDAGVEGDFIFRIYSTTANSFFQLIHNKPEASALNCCAKAPQLLTQLTVMKAHDLEKQESGGADPYCIILVKGTA